MWACQVWPIKSHHLMRRLRSDIATWKCCFFTYLNCKTGCYFSIEFNIMVKHCSHVTCKSDSRYPEKNSSHFRCQSLTSRNLYDGYHFVEDHMPSLTLTKLWSIHMCVQCAILDMYCGPLISSLSFVLWPHT